MKKTPPNIWVMKNSEESIQTVTKDVVSAVGAVVLHWFRQWDSLNSVLSLFEMQDPIETSEGMTWGFGRRGSPVNHILTGFVSLETGNYKSAYEHLNAALQKGPLLVKVSGRPEIVSEIEAAMRKAKSMLEINQHP